MTAPRQAVAGASDGATGALLVVAPSLDVLWPLPVNLLSFSSSELSAARALRPQRALLRMGCGTGLARERCRADSRVLTQLRKSAMSMACVASAESKTSITLTGPRPDRARS